MRQGYTRACESEHERLRIPGGKDQHRVGKCEQPWYCRSCSHSSSPHHHALRVATAIWGHDASCHRTGEVAGAREQPAHECGGFAGTETSPPSRSIASTLGAIREDSWSSPCFEGFPATVSNRCISRLRFELDSSRLNSVVWAHHLRLQSSLTAIHLQPSVWHLCNQDRALKWL